MKKGYWYILLATVLFSSMEIALKSIAGQFNPIQMNLIRFLVGGLILIPFARQTLKKRKEALNSSSILYFAFLGFLGVVVSMTFYQLAVESANASEVAVLFSSNPVFILIFSGIILHEVIKKNHVVAIVFEIIGILVIINPLHTQINIPGVVMAILAALAFALYSVFGKEHCARYGGITITCGSFLCASVEMVLLIAISHIGPVADFLGTMGLGMFADIPVFTGFTLSNIAVMLYICVAVTGGGYAFYFLAMEETSASTASLVFFLKPVLSPIFAMFILGESIPINMVIGIVLILVGSMANLLPAFMQSKKIPDETTAALST
ncbi:MAG: DMT family transporter, partial [Eubacterium sp.]